MALPSYRKRALIKRLGEKCVECGAVDNLTIDHIIPVSKGGRPTAVGNLQVLCFTCNQKKGDKYDYTY